MSTPQNAQAPLMQTLFQVFSSENWPDILYNATAAEAVNGQAWLSALFIAGWFLFANFILLQMFIAVINEGFAIAEEEKHKAQIRAFAKQNEPPEPSVSWISRLNPYRLFKKRWHGATVDAVSANPIAPFGKATIHDYVAGPWGSKFIGYTSQTHQNNGTFISSLRRAAVRKGQSDKTLFKASTRPVRGSAGEGDEEIWDVDQRLSVSAGNRTFIALTLPPVSETC